MSSQGLLLKIVVACAQFAIANGNTDSLVSISRWEPLIAGNGPLERTEGLSGGG